MPVYEVENFGPMAAIITMADQEEAVRVANDSPFGLGAAVFIRENEKILCELTSVDYGSF